MMEFSCSMLIGGEGDHLIHPPPIADKILQFAGFVQQLRINRAKKPGRRKMSKNLYLTTDYRDFAACRWES